MKRRWDPYTAIRRLRVGAFVLATLWPAVFALGMLAPSSGWKLFLGPLRFANLDGRINLGVVAFTTLSAAWINGWLFLCRDRTLRVFFVSLGVLFWLCAGCLSGGF
ncbi:MAG: hypothetical protein AAGE52_24950 [Myxococcota bacterium]